MDGYPTGARPVKRAASSLIESEIEEAERRFLKRRRASEKAALAVTATATKTAKTATTAKTDADTETTAKTETTTSLSAGCPPPSLKIELEKAVRDHATFCMLDGQTVCEVWEGLLH